MAWLERGRVFCCIMPAGISWSDRTRERDGDYIPLAFLPFRSLTLEVYKDCPESLRTGVEHDAARIQARRGQQYQVSACGQTVILGK